MPPMTRAATRKSLNSAAKTIKTTIPTTTIPTRPNSQPVSPKSNRKMGKSSNNKMRPRITAIPPIRFFISFLVYPKSG